jgi:hypothetical protein
VANGLKQARAVLEDVHGDYCRTLSLDYNEMKEFHGNREVTNPFFQEADNLGD